MKLTLKKQIHSCFASVSSNDVYLKKEFNLPFTPFIGLNLHTDGDFEEKIEELWYQTDKKCFVAYSEDKELYTAELQGRKSRDIETIIQEYLDIGWER